MKKIKFIIESGEKNYSCFTDDLPTGLVVSTGKSISGLKEKATEALNEHVSACMEDGDEVPEWLAKGKYEISFVFDTQSFLQHYGKIISRAGLSRITGINEKQLGHYIQGLHKPRRDKAKKIEQSLHNLGEELLSVELV